MTASENSRSTIFQESLVLPFKLNAFTSGTSWQHMHFNLVGISLQFWQLHHSWELILLCWVSGSRSSCSDMICKKGVLRNFTRFTGKHLSQRCFTVSFAKFLRAPFFTEHLRWLLPEKFSKYWHENTCFVFREKSSAFLFFLTLSSAGIYLFKVWSCSKFG